MPSGPSEADDGVSSAKNDGSSNWRYALPETQSGGSLRRVLSHALIDICEDSEFSTPKQVSLDPSSPDLAYRIGACSSQGRSSKMEDRVLVSDLTNNPHFSHAARAVLLAVFDGHAGHEAADHMSATLQHRLLASPFLAVRDYGGALRDTLLEAERTLLAEFFTSGTTALVVLMVDRMLYIANVGDCRAVVCDDAEARALTWDHKPTNNRLEKARLEASGAKLSTDGYVEVDANGERIDGIALSRALGGAYIKLAPAGLASSQSSGSLGGTGSAMVSPLMSPAGARSSGGGGPGALPAATGWHIQQKFLQQRILADGVQRQSAESLPRRISDGQQQQGWGGPLGMVGQQQERQPRTGGTWPQSSSSQPPASSPFCAYPGSRQLDQQHSSGRLSPPTSLSVPPMEVNSQPHSHLLHTLSAPAPAGHALMEQGLGTLSQPSISLGVSRQNSNLASEGSVVIAEPELFQYSIHQGSEFLILGSDGLWDKVRNVEAVARVRRWLGECGQSVEEAAAGLVDYAIKMDSHDNVSVVLLRFSSRPILAVGAARNANSALRRARSVAFMADSSPAQQQSQPLAPITAEDCAMAEGGCCDQAPGLSTQVV